MIMQAITELPNILTERSKIPTEYSKAQSCDASSAALSLVGYEIL